MTANPFGELRKAVVREHWKHEEHDFTPWLAQPENIERLATALGLELEVESVEKACGPYWADILARESGSDRFVIIENQFGKTNHDHLGKLITYAAVLDAGKIVWISEHFTDEHQKALDWLNDHTTGEVSFYGVSLELWRIDDSKPAIRFNVISRPTEAVKQANASKDPTQLSDARRLQLDFWTAVQEKLLADKVISSTQSPRAQYWFNVKLGRAGIYLSNIANTDEGKIAVRLYLCNRVAEAALAQLLPQRHEIERELREKLQWDPYPDNRDKVVALERHAALNERDRWPEYVEWMVDHIRKFREVFGPIVKALDLSARAFEDSEDSELYNGEVRE